MATPFVISKGDLGLSLTNPGKAAALAELSDYTDFSCVVTSAKITATTNSNTTNVPATFCATASEETIPASSTYTLEGTVLQDPDAVAGLQAFIWANSSSETGDPIYFYLGLTDGGKPKCVGQVLVSELDFGGPAGEVLTADFSWPCTGGRPDIEFGTTAVFDAD